MKQPEEIKRALADLPPDQKIVLAAVLSLDNSLPNTGPFSMLLISPGNLSEITGLDSPTAIAAADQLWPTGFLHCWQATRADDADATFIGYCPSHLARHWRAYMLGCLEQLFAAENTADREAGQ